MAHTLRIVPARILSAAIATVLPPRCPACGVVVPGDGLFCAACFTGLKLLSPPWCARCGEPFALDMPPATLCTRCAADPPAFAEARAALAYADPAKSLALRLKHGDATQLAAVMAVQMARVAADWLTPEVLLVPVPLHRWRLWRRGYNQAALIAQALARRTPACALLDGLVRTRATPPSAGMTRDERQANVRGAFAVPRPDRIAGRAIVLIDDVLTSGATMDACARALLDAGSGPVRALAFARVAHGARPYHTGLE